MSTLAETYTPKSLLLNIDRITMWDSNRNIFDVNYHKKYHYSISDKVRSTALQALTKLGSWVTLLELNQVPVQSSSRDYSLVVEVLRHHQSYQKIDGIPVTDGDIVSYSLSNPNWQVVNGCEFYGEPDDIIHQLRQCDVQALYYEDLPGNINVLKTANEFLTRIRYRIFANTPFVLNSQ